MLRRPRVASSSPEKYLPLVSSPSLIVRYGHASVCVSAQARGEAMQDTEVRITRNCGDCGKPLHLVQDSSGSAWYHATAAADYACHKAGGAGDGACSCPPDYMHQADCE